MNNTSPENLPKLTVIMAVRNAASTIARSLDSMVAQHYPNLEFIICDALSNDGTLEIIQSYKHIITTLKSERDNGPPDAHNKAIQLATGDYIGFLNADDEYEPGMLWAVADSIMNNPGNEVISSGMMYRAFDKNGNSRITGYYADKKQLSITLDYILIENQTFLLSRFFKRALLLEEAPFNTDKNLWYYSSDREFMARLALRKCTNIIIPKALYGFTFHKESLSNNPDNYTKIVEEHLMISDKLLARNDLDKTHIQIIGQWRKRQLVFGFWQALAKFKIDKAESFMKYGIASGIWKFAFLCLYLLIQKMLKRLFLKLSRGIDRGTILR